MEVKFPVMLTGRRLEKVKIQNQVAVQLTFWSNQRSDVQQVDARSRDRSASNIK